MKTRLLAVAILSIFFLSASAQSGWVKEKGNYFLKADVSGYTSKDYRNLDGNKVATSKFSQQAFSIYGEYGLSKKFTGIFNMPLLKHQGYSTTNNVTGIGDLRLELKYAIQKGKYPISLSVAPEIPIGTQGLKGVAKDNSGAFINLPTGDGEFNVWTTAAISHSFYPKPFYTTVYSAFNYRTSYKGTNFQNQYAAGAEFGYKVEDKVWLTAKYSATTGVGTSPVFADFIRGNGVSFSTVVLSATYEFDKHWAITTQYSKVHSGIVQAKNVYAANMFSVGLTYAKKR